MMIKMDIYEKQCEYCHEPVSVFESLTEFGKHYHDSCYIQKTHRQLEGYKKKFIDGTLTKGDKAIFLDEFILSKKLIAESKTEFKGWTPIGEKKKEHTAPEKRMLVDEQFRPITDTEGNPKFEETKTGSSMTTLIMRPQVKVIEKPKKLRIAEIKKEKLTTGDIPRIMEQI